MIPPKLNPTGNIYVEILKDGHSQIETLSPRSIEINETTTELDYFVNHITSDREFSFPIQMKSIDRLPLMVLLGLCTEKQAMSNNWRKMHHFPMKRRKYDNRRNDSRH